LFVCYSTTTNIKPAVEIKPTILIVQPAVGMPPDMPAAKRTNEPADAKLKTMTYVQSAITARRGISLT